jgi:hypothetical protein
MEYKSAGEMDLDEDMELNEEMEQLELEGARTSERANDPSRGQQARSFRHRRDQKSLFNRSLRIKPQTFCQSRTAIQITISLAYPRSSATQQVSLS